MCKRKHILLIILCIVLVLLLIKLLPDFSVEALLAHTPSKPVNAVAFILILYILKSLTIFFPVIVLQIASGIIFPVWAALLINLLGIVIILTVPYYIGKVNGMAAIQKLTDRYPKFQGVLDKQMGSTMFLSFFLRIISCLPGDIVTMYFGATKTPFWKNLGPGTLGLLPGMILATLIGQSIQDPGSPMFWISAIAMAFMAISSALLYRHKMQKEGGV